MVQFRTSAAVAACVAVALWAGPAQASGVGGSFTDTPSSVQTQVSGQDSTQINDQETINTNITGSSQVTATTNIDSSRNVSASQEINGQNVAYGWNGSNVMGNIMDRSGDVANYSQSRRATAQAIEGMIMNAFGLPLY